MVIASAGGSEIARSGPGLGAQLRVNCLVLCGGLEYHHTMETSTMFPPLREGHPDLAPVLERLDREHWSIAALLTELQRVVSTGTAQSSTVLAEVDRLAAELEGHLAYEEDQLIPILGMLTA